VRTLLVDTNVLLDMTIAEMGRVDESAQRALLKRTTFLVNTNSVVQLKRFLRSFGDVMCSAGSLIEADRLAAKAVQSGNRDYAPSPHLIAFWKACAQILANRSVVFEDLPPFECEPFDLVPDVEDVARHGPVDEHLLDIARRNTDRLSLLSTDQALTDRASRVIGERAIPVTAMLF